MRPVGHAAGAGCGPDAADELHTEPQPQHDPRRDREDAEKDNEDDQNVDFRPWEKQKIAPHHPGNRARGPDHGHPREWLCHNLAKPRRDATGEVEKQIAPMAHFIFDIVAEDPQKQHVTGQMHPATMQELRGDKAEIPLPMVQPRGQQGVGVIELPQSAFI